MGINEYIDMQNVQVIKCDNNEVFVMTARDYASMAEMRRVYDVVKSTLPENSELIFIPSIVQLTTMSIKQLKQLGQMIDSFVEKRESENE